VKDRVDFPEIVFRGMDRIGLILASASLDHQQLGRSVDYLVAITHPLRSKTKNETNGKTSKRKMSGDEYYEAALNLLSNTTGLLQDAGLLTRRVKAGGT